MPTPDGSMFSEEETRALLDTWANTPPEPSTEAEKNDVLAVATKAAELLAARVRPNLAPLEAAVISATQGPENAKLREAWMTALNTLGARIAALEAQLSRLKPSGQVTADTETVREGLLRREAPIAVPDIADEALSRLVAGAQQADALGKNWELACAKADEQRERAEAAEERLQQLREGIQAIVERCVAMAKAAGEPEAATTHAEEPQVNAPCTHASRWHAPIGGTGFVCSECGTRVPDALVARVGAIRVERYPCSPTCTHDDATTPGHPERVRERSEGFLAAAKEMP
jgi:hypothetical protein